MADTDKPSEYDKDCMDMMGKLSLNKIKPKRYRIRENWSDFSSIWIEDPNGDWIYDPNHKIKPNQ